MGGFDMGGATGVERLKASLNQYYMEHKIHPHGFACPHRDVCAGTSDQFVEAKMPSIGDRYGQDGLPRILVVSLDPGDEGDEPKDRTVHIRSTDDWSFVQAQENKNSHWYRTHELVHALLLRFKPDLPWEEVTRYFAHTNSAKCSQRKDGNRKADPVLFRNCRAYIPGEIALFDPEIIITQGNEAWYILEHSFEKVSAEEHCCENHGITETISVVAVPTGGLALWLHTYHPTSDRYPSRYFRRYKPHYCECHPEIAWRFLQGQYLPRTPHT